MLKNEEIRQKYPFFREGLNYFEAKWILCGCICTARKEEWKDYCDFVDMAHQNLIKLSVTRWLSLYRSLPTMLQLYTQLQIHTSCPSTNCCSEMFFFGNSLIEFCFNTDTCNYLWLLLLSKFRILRSQKHQLLRLYRVSSLWRQGSSRNNQMYISSQVKSALRKLSEGKDHGCDSFTPDGPLHLLNLNALTRILRLQTTNWENDELCE